MRGSASSWAPYQGKMLKCNQRVRWRGVRWGGTVKIEVCNGHYHMLENPEEI